MGLLDAFRRTRKPTPEHLIDLYERVGALGAELKSAVASVEALRAEWTGTRDVFTKLAQRLEKREQRAQAPQNGEPEPDPGFDPVQAERLMGDWRRRRRM